MVYLNIYSLLFINILHIVLGSKQISRRMSRNVSYSDLAEVNDNYLKTFDSSIPSTVAVVAALTSVNNNNMDMNMDNTNNVYTKDSNYNNNLPTVNEDDGSLKSNLHSMTSLQQQMDEDAEQEMLITKKLENISYPKYNHVHNNNSVLVDEEIKINEDKEKERFPLPRRSYLIQV